MTKTAFNFRAAYSDYVALFVVAFPPLQKTNPFKMAQKQQFGFEDFKS